MLVTKLDTTKTLYSQVFMQPRLWTLYYWVLILSKKWYDSSNWMQWFTESVIHQILSSIQLKNRAKSGPNLDLHLRKFFVVLNRIKSSLIIRLFSVLRSYLSLSYCRDSLSQSCPSDHWSVTSPTKKKVDEIFINRMTHWVMLSNLKNELVLPV